MPVLGAGPVALLFQITRALISRVQSAEGKLIFTPSSIVGSTDDIPGTAWLLFLKQLMCVVVLRSVVLILNVRLVMAY